MLGISMHLLEPLCLITYLLKDTFCKKYLLNLSRELEIRSEGNVTNGKPATETLKSEVATTVSRPVQVPMHTELHTEIFGTGEA